VASGASDHSHEAARPIPRRRPERRGAPSHLTPAAGSGSGEFSPPARGCRWSPRWARARITRTPKRCWTHWEHAPAARTSPAVGGDHRRGHWPL